MLPRGDFPFLASSDVTYLDSAAVCPSPRSVIAAMEQYVTGMPLNYGVGVSDLAERVVRAVDTARESVARFIGAAPHEIAFTRNTTEAIGLVAHGLRWAPGDEVIVTEVDHQANLLPWYRLREERGVEVRVADADDGFVVRPEAVRGLLSDRTRLVTTTAVSNLFGTIQLLERLARLAHEAGALFLVDAAQALGRVPMDVQEIGCDLAACCGRKSLLGPQGSAFLYQRGGEVLAPLHAGSRAARLGEGGRVDLLPAPGRFEAGMPDAQAIVGLGAATDYLRRVGVDAIHRRIVGLTARLKAGLENVRVKVYGAAAPDREAGILSIGLSADVDPSSLARALWEHARIIVASGTLGSPLAAARVGDPLLRTSVHAFNTEEDVDIFLSALTDLLR